MREVGDQQLLRDAVGNTLHFRNGAIAQAEIGHQHQRRGLGRRILRLRRSRQRQECQHGDGNQLLQHELRSFLKGIAILPRRLGFVASRDSLNSFGENFMPRVYPEQK